MGFRRRKNTRQPKLRARTIPVKSMQENLAVMVQALAVQQVATVAMVLHLQHLQLAIPTAAVQARMLHRQLATPKAVVEARVMQ